MVWKRGVGLCIALLAVIILLLALANAYVIVISVPPSSCEGDYADCANAFVDDSQYSQGTNLGASGNWSGYSIDTSSIRTINSVKLRVKHCVGTALIAVRFRAWNGSAWSSDYISSNPGSCPTEEVIDISSFIDEPSELSSLIINARISDSGGPPATRWHRIYYIPVEVNYTEFNNPPNITGNVTNDGPVTATQQITFTGNCTDPDDPEPGDYFRLLVCNGTSYCNTSTPADSVLCNGTNSKDTTPSCSYTTTESDIGNHTGDIGTCCDDENLCDPAHESVDMWQVLPPPTPPNITGPVTNDGPVYNGEMITFTASCTDPDSGDLFRLVVCRENSPSCDAGTSGNDLICSGTNSDDTTPSCSYTTQYSDIGTNYNDRATCCDGSGFCDPNPITIEPWTVERTGADIVYNISDIDAHLDPDDFNGPPIDSPLLHDGNTSTGDNYIEEGRGRRDSILSIKKNSDPSNYTNIHLRFYTLWGDSDPFEYRVYVYLPDGNNINTTGYIDSQTTSSSGWQEVDITPIVHQLDGEGFYRVRLVSIDGPQKELHISEVEFVQIKNSPPSVTNVVVDDESPSPLDEIDLSAGSVRQVNCTATASDPNGYEDIMNATAYLYHEDLSYETDADDNNTHYTSSCLLYDGSGEDVELNCPFRMAYYAYNGTWRCVINATDSHGSRGRGVDQATVNPLIALDIPPLLDFGLLDVGLVSPEEMFRITNLGNLRIDVTMDGYGSSDGDGNAMNCSAGTIPSIPVSNLRYNMSGPGSDYSLMKQLSDTPTIENNLSLAPRTNLTNSTRDTYWRINVSGGAAGRCNGIITVTGVWDTG